MLRLCGKQVLTKTIVATSSGSALICGFCGSGFEFAQSFDRRLPVSDALAAGWGTARTDKDIVDYACPACLAVDRTQPDCDTMSS